MTSVLEGVHALAGRSDSELAAAVARLWEDPALGRRLAEAGAKLVQDRYSRVAHRALVAEAIRDAHKQAARS